MQEIYESNKAAFKQLAFMKTISSTTIDANRVHAEPLLTLIEQRTPLL